MASRTCMNVSCGASSSTEWRKGWALRSGDFATLCDKCGSAYEQSIFCDVFHLKDSGWRECASCGKNLHCGCIASKFLMELHDSGGVNCISCAKDLELHITGTSEKLNGLGTPQVQNSGALQTLLVEDDNSDRIRLVQQGNKAEGNELRESLLLQSNDKTGSLVQMKHEENISLVKDVGYVSSLEFNQATTNGLNETAKQEICKADNGTKFTYDSLAFGCGSRSRHLIPKPARALFNVGLEPNASMVSQVRVARPPAEGRGRNQLLPRYWPRITDQELQQISGASNSTVVPLFEKMLSASDAGRIGRLVVPKACAEAYFPPISQPEGLPIRIQDIKGKEWVFQFRFWPNNNSRMYVLEGVTPCIQSMQLQAGDTVTFSRMDPEGKLIMGFRKASSSSIMQDTHPNALSTAGGHSSEFFSSVFENLPMLSGHSSLLQSLKGNMDPHLNLLPGYFNQPGADMSWQKAEKHDDKSREGLLLSSMLAPERKRTRNIGSKSKRLLVDCQDALELKLKWDEVQDLLRPPPTVKPSKFVIEDHEFEEYEEPPVFGKRSIFLVRSNRGQEQWAQCDDCSKWRKLPVDVLLPSKWTCVENIWDQSMSSCSTPEELTTRELEHILRLNKEFKRQRTLAFSRPIQDHESSGLDALANAATLGDNVSDPGTASVATTTRHPRHRPGCSCIVCIQPPSGKGKHKPTCTCNVCMTVKRRFKTLMMRKKKRQSEREAEIAQKNQLKWGSRDETELDNTSRHVSLNLGPSENEAQLTNESRSQSNLVETGKDQLDLNCHPDQENEVQGVSNRVSMMSLVQIASLPLETYLKQNGLTSLLPEPQVSLASSHAPVQGANEVEGAMNDDDGCFASSAQDQESEGEEICEKDQS
ncbi:B3 domain-containing transcription repressor VAL2 isoform X2 [Cucurbita pepo subsp. pepo]|uniref:B3 domain-containing transcription repressor VAL2 isoform X2 n=1 Tax=Cucurbita pepo subsp. pepo TaxID=3664 RepID=UPI000C9D55E0|nr:B3 domain-containing transcription repressor VAL2 isoform X2 [Cucurbita pepo subsp. pepo]